jgi:hypothetical protein
MKEKFLKNGYTLYIQNGKEFLQKCIRDEVGNKKYFININIEDFRSLKGLYAYDKQYSNFPDFLYNADCQLNTTKSGNTFNVELLTVSSVELTEQFFEEIFQKMDCRNYED